MIKKFFLGVVVLIFGLCGVSFMGTEKRPPRILQRVKHFTPSRRTKIHQKTKHRPSPVQTRNTPVLFTLPTAHSLALYPARTALSQKALRLRIGMTSQEVIKLLGPPTKSQYFHEALLGWFWENAPCESVSVSFDKNRRVNGFDEGRANCFQHHINISTDD